MKTDGKMVLATFDEMAVAVKLAATAMVDERYGQASFPIAEPEVEMVAPSFFDEVFRDPPAEPASIPPAASSSALAIRSPTPPLARQVDRPAEVPARIEAARMRAPALNYEAQVALLRAIADLASNIAMLCVVAVLAVAIFRSTGKSPAPAGPTSSELKSPHSRAHMDSGTQGWRPA